MKQTLENKIEEQNPITIIGNSNEELRKYAEEHHLPIRYYDSEDQYQKNISPARSLGDFTRKSIVGAAYRVGASFTIDAIYLTAAGALGYYLAQKAGIAESIENSASDFIKNLDPAKLARIAAAVVLINFADYKLNITERLDKGAKGLIKKAKSLMN